jgi:long-chain acyl-CoA synthetase
LSLGKVLFGLGLKAGDRVALLDYNSIELSLVNFGVPVCGMVALPLNYRLSPRELADVINDSQSAALIYCPAVTDLVNQIRSKLPSVKYFLCTSTSNNDSSLPSLLEKVPNISLPEPKPEDLAHLLYTSGTTGRPKGVQLTHSNSVATIKSLLIDLRFEPNDIGLMIAPLFHIAGIHTFMGLIARGCTVHLLPSFDPIKTLDTLRSTKATVTLLVPAMIAALMNRPDLNKLDLSSLRMVIYAGAPMPEELLKTCINRFGYKFLQVYGTTETSAITCLTIDDHRRPQYFSSAGRQFFGNQVKVVDENDRETPPGEIGEVILRGENVMTGYWNAPEETALVLKDGWFHTGDMGLSDGNGYIFLKDRKKDMIVTGGENVYPVEIENVLLQIPAISEVAVIGVPDKQWGEKVLAIVHLRPDPKITAEEIISFCRERLAGYKCPKAVEFTASPLPRTPSGKVKKNILSKPYWEGFDRKIH